MELKVFVSLFLLISRKYVALVCNYKSNVWSIKIRTTDNLSWIFLDNIIVWAPSILYFKGLGIRNLQYEMRICQINHNKVIKTAYGSNFYESDITDFEIRWITHHNKIMRWPLPVEIDLSRETYGLISLNRILGIYISFFCLSYN